VKRLIEAGCDIDRRNVNGITCAIYAASAGRLEALRVLAEAGADLGIRTPDGFDALDSAATLPVLRFLKPLVNQAV
jgi:ankyrin repeat protein